MATPNTKPFTGTMSYDMTPMATIIVDLAPGVAGKLRYEMPGIHPVLVELDENLTDHAESIELSSTVATTLATYNGNIAQLDAACEIVGKMYEVLLESKAKNVHDREILIGRIAKAAKSAAKSKDPSFLAPFAKTVAYHGQIGERAAKTRKRNQEEAQLAQLEAAAQRRAAQKKAAKAQAPKAKASKAKAKALDSKALANGATATEDPPPSLRAA